VLTYVSRFLGDNIPGLESQIYEEYIRLSKQISLIVITEEISTGQLYKNLSLVKVPRVAIPKIRGLFKIFSYSLATIKHRNNYDLTYVRTFSPPELIAGIIAKKILKKPLILLIPGSWMFVGNSFKTRIFRSIYHKAIISANTIIVYSKLITSEIENLVGKIDQSKIVIIKNAVDTTRFKPNSSQKNNTILYVGRIDPLKGIEDIIAAVPAITKSNPDVKVHIVGLIESKNYLHHLQDLTLKLNCEKSVNFVGPIPHDKIIPYYNDSQIFVFMGRNEGIPRSILEAMACGKPVIAAPNSGIPDVIKDGINGFLINNNQPNLLAEKIIMLLNDKKHRENIGLAARKTIEDKFTWESFVEQLTKLFRDDLV